MSNLLADAVDLFTADQNQQVFLATITAFNGNLVQVRRRGQTAPDAQYWPRLDTVSNAELVVGAEVLMLRCGSGLIVIGKVLRAGDPSSATETLGEIYISAEAATTIAVMGTFYKVAGTTLLIAASTVDVDMPADNRLRYIGAVSHVFEVAIAFSAKSASANQELAFRIAVDGGTLPESNQNARFQTAAQVYMGICRGIVTLAPNSYVELWATNESGANNLTIEHMVMTIQGT